MACEWNLENTATLGGVIHAVMDCDVSIYMSNFAKNYAELGACLNGARLSAKVKSSKFWDNYSSQSGGCFCIDSSTVRFEATELYLNQAEKYGGAISASLGSLLHLENSKVFSNSALNGGGVALLFDSRILSASCTFRNNTANGGGGVYIESQMKETIIAQFAMSIFLNNIAYQYGGKNNIF